MQVLVLFLILSGALLIESPVGLALIAAAVLLAASR